MTPEEEALRGGEANMILGSPIFKEACKRIDEGLAAQRLKVGITDTDKHTALILTEQLWNNLKEWIEQVAQTGRFANIALEKLERQRTLRQRAEGKQRNGGRNR